MYYLIEGFNNCASIIFGGHGLSDSDKDAAIVINTLPQAVDSVGKIPVLKCKKATNEVWYDYIDEPINETDRIAALEDAVAELILGGAM